MIVILWKLNLTQRVFYRSESIMMHRCLSHRRVNRFHGAPPKFQFWYPINVAQAVTFNNGLRNERYEKSKPVKEAICILESWIGGWG